MNQQQSSNTAVRIQVEEMKSYYELRFKYDTTIYHAVKDIEGSWWVPDARVWRVPKKRREEVRRVIARFNKIDYDSNMVVTPMQADLIDTADFTVDKTMPELTIQVNLRGILRPYQGTGAAYGIEKGSCIMGDQQGLGKTITAITAVEAQNAFPCLVVCKSSLTTNWENEINAWSYHRGIRFNDSVKRSWPAFFSTGYCHYAIVSYDSLRKYFVQEILDYEAAGRPFTMKDIILKPEAAIFKSIIVDESHLIKDDTILRTKITVKLCMNRQNVYCLSGTPVLNNPEELYPQLVACGKHQFFGTKKSFKELYGKGGKNKQKALKYLNYLLHRHCYFRRLKSEVATEIPPKTRRVVLCEITNREEYALAEKHFKKYLEERLKMTGGQIDKAMRAEALVQMQHLKFLSAKGKLQAIQEWIDSLSDAGEKAVIFVFRKEIQEEIYHYRREGTVRLCSTATPDILAKRKEQFQTDDRVERIICSISADAEGHTLTAATNLAMYELPWHWGKAEQCEDRIHRIGTIHPVNIDYFLGERTIDRDIYDLIMEKKDMHDIITGTQEEEAENQVVDKLISIFNQK